MAEPVKDKSAKRRYHSPSRQAQAARTRAQILEAADELFRAQGFGATTIRQVAEAAAVVPETVYANFGSKVRLLTALIDAKLAPDGEASVVDRPEHQAIAEEPDQLSLLERCVRDWAAMSERARPVSEILRAAAGADPDVAVVRDEMEEHRHGYARLIAGLLADRGPLLVDVDQAADIIWAVASPDVARMLCDERGWDNDDLVPRLVSMLAAALLPPSALGGA
jgi:AcrR family transcriptional regulator